MILAMLVVMVIAILIGQLRKAKNNQHLVQGLSTPKEDPAQLAAKEQSTEELLQIGERFTQALDTLKTLNLKASPAAKRSTNCLGTLLWGRPARENNSSH